MDIQLLYKVVLPTLARSGVAFIGISTLADPFNFWSQMLDLKDDDGKPVFKTIRYSLVCEACAKAGKEDTCRCNLGDLPYWQDEAQHNKLEKIMQDKCDTYLTETKGFLSNPNIRPAFPVKAVQRLMERKEIKELPMRTCFFVSVDPAAGGNLSDYAIVSNVYTRRGEICIVGVEAYSYKSAVPQAKLLINHISAVRCIPGLEGAYAILVVESNLAFEAMHHEMYVRQAGLANVIVMCEDTHDRPGVRMTKGLKRTMVVQLGESLQQDRIGFYHRTVSINGKRDADAMKKELLGQIGNFKRVIEPPAKVHQEPKEMYTGKSGGGKDDLVIALMWNIFAKNRFYSQPEKYSKYFDSDNEFIVG